MQRRVPGGGAGRSGARWRCAWVALLTALVCACPPTTPATRCFSARDCPEGYTCDPGFAMCFRARVRPDASGAEHPEDGAMDAGAVDRAVLEDRQAPADRATTDGDGPRPGDGPARDRLTGVDAGAADRRRVDGCVVFEDAGVVRELPVAGAPVARFHHSAVWMEGRLFVWGGRSSSSLGCDEAPFEDHLDSGGVYDPCSDTWAPLPLEGAPSPRLYPRIFWTGSEVLVWGGCYYWEYGLEDGAAFSPAQWAWRPIAPLDAPARRGGHLAAWTGSEMLIWGGNGQAIGNRYNPDTDTWQPINPAGAPPRLYNAVAVWTGAEWVMIGPISSSFGSAPIAGGAYDPSSDTWRPVNTEGISTWDWYYTSVWTGREMILFDGGATGGIYDPASDSWRPIGSGGPGNPSRYLVAWDGRHMVVAGSLGGTPGVWLFDPDAELNARWSLYTQHPTLARRGHRGGLDGRTLYLWGGADAAGALLQTGAAVQLP